MNIEEAFRAIVSIESAESEGFTWLCKYLPLVRQCLWFELPLYPSIHFALIFLQELDYV